MKTFKVTSLRQPSVVQTVISNGLIPNEITIEGDDDLQVSDGYHTMDELYEHRIILFITLIRQLFYLVGQDGERAEVWCSKLHSDGSSFDGWFIVGIGTDYGGQITYHLPLKYWNEVINWALYRERAPEYDGHTSADVLERLKSL